MTNFFQKCKKPLFFTTLLIFLVPFLVLFVLDINHAVTLFCAQSVHTKVFLH